MFNDPLLGRQLGNFHIERMIGRGGMAQVYYGWDVVLERPVAVKVIASRFRHDQAYTERFLREARTVARWRHENIVQVYYAGEEEGLYYLVMEYVDGGDLAALLDVYQKAERLPPHGEVLGIARAVAAALDYAHQRDVIHRDVKPSNVLINREGRVLLSDFGLVLDRREGSSGEVLGSPRYVAPEQARRSTAAVPQSDLYSLGVILYEMLVGRAPFEDPSPTSLALQHITEAPPAPRTINPDLSPAVSDVLLKVLSKQPEDRFQRGAELVDSLGAALDVKAVPPPVIRLQQPVVARDAHPTDPRPPQRRVSSVPVKEKIAERLNATQREAPERRRVVSAAPRRSGRSRLFWLGVGFVAVCALALSAGAFLLIGAVRGGPAASLWPGQEATATPATGEEDGAGSGPQTEEGVQGRPLQFLYNEVSFYAYNPGPDDLPVEPLRFEALGRDGQPAGFAFGGERWAVYYPLLQAGRCNRLTIFDASGYLSPDVCSAYNAMITPEPDDPFLFWLPRENVTHFRVLWQGEATGRCEIAAGRCEVVLP